MEEINFTKEEQQELKEYIKEINKKTYSLDTIRQLIDLKKATIFAKRILQYTQETKCQLDTSLDEIKRIRKEEK